MSVAAIAYVCEVSVDTVKGDLAAAGLSAAGGAPLLRWGRDATAARSWRAGRERAAVGRCAWCSLPAGGQLYCSVRCRVRGVGAGWPAAA